MKEGDFIVAIGDTDVKWSPHEDVVRLIKEAGDSLSLKLVTPMDRNYLKVSQSFCLSNTHMHTIFIIPCSLIYLLLIIFTIYNFLIRDRNTVESI